jgi:hypothetical protein
MKTLVLIEKQVNDSHRSFRHLGYQAFGDGRQIKPWPGDESQSQNHGIFRAHRGLEELAACFPEGFPALGTALGKVAEESYLLRDGDSFGMQEVLELRNREMMLRCISGFPGFVGVRLLRIMICRL